MAISWKKARQQPDRRLTKTGALACAALFISIACSTRHAGKTTDQIARQYVGLAVALGERDPDSIDFYFGPDHDVAQMLRSPPSTKAIAEQAAGLLADLARDAPLSSVERRRREFLRTQLEALKFRASMLLGTMRSFDEESQMLFGVVAPPDHESTRRVQDRVRIAQWMRGTRKGPAASYSRYERQFVVASDKVPQVMQAALGQCRAQALRHVAMPAGEHVDVEYVFHKPWSGFSRYTGKAHSVIQVNMDFPHTVDELLNLACHEGYPGHHMFNTLRDTSLTHGLQEEEWTVQPTFSPQSFVSESAATYAAEMAFSPGERLRVERDILFPLTGIDPRKAAHYVVVEGLVGLLDGAEPAIAKEYLDGRLEFERARDALERETLMEHPETVLLYLNEYRSYMLTYTVGARMVRSLVLEGNPTQDVRWSRYRKLMTEPRYRLPDLRNAGLLSDTPESSLDLTVHTN